MKQKAIHSSLEKLVDFPVPFREEIKRHIQLSAGIINLEQWLVTFSKLSNAIQARRCTYRQVEDHVFELKCMSFLRVALPEYRITYQPVGTNPKGANCDIVAIGPKRYLIELKCLHPSACQKAIPRNHIPDNNQLMMDPTTYHQYQAVRGHLVDIARDAEKKFKNYGTDYVRVLGVLLNLYLTGDHLEDFVALYRGKPQPDDPLAKMTTYKLRDPFHGTIDEFWSFPFQQASFDHEKDEQLKNL